MTTVEPAAPPATMPEGAHPVTLPVMVVEGLDTSDHRHIEAGALTTRTLPITLFAQTRSTHGADGDAATWAVGAITEAVRRPGPEVIQRSTGQPFPEGTYVWEGRGWVYPDVPAAPLKSAFEMLRDGVLTGNSVDLSGVEAEFEYAEDAEPGDPPERIVTTKAAIASTTLVAQPAFEDAFATLDGVDMAPATEALVAAGEPVPAWRSADVGDVCGPCAAGLTAAGDEDVDVFATGDDVDPPRMPNATEDYSTSGMVALVPANPAMLLAEGGDTADELHLTLAYLGDQVDRWVDEQKTAVWELGRELASWVDGPVTAGIFSHAVFNPNGDSPASVYLLDGTADRERIDAMAREVQDSARRALGDALFPEQHKPFVPHVTAGYRLPVNRLTYTGPVEFDRLRVAFGDDIVDYPLGGGDPALIASAATLPPASLWENPNLPGPTAPTVTEDGRCFGHLATWGTCHIGFQGQCVQPPRSASGYAYFHVHSVRAQRDGEPVTIPVGYGTIGTGHADIRAGAMSAAEHYDNTGTAAFEIVVGEDEHGIWFSGRLIPGLDQFTEHKARGTVFSGDWRTIRGSLELVAALGVNTPGFPVPRARVASGAPLAVVAAGALSFAPERPTPQGAPVWRLEDQPRDVQAAIGWLIEARHTEALAELDEALGDGFTASELAEADLAYALDADHPWFREGVSLAEEGGDGDETLVAAGRKVLHLPPYIKRIANHLKKKGMAQGQAIATAVNAAKKMCRTGDLNFPGSQQVNPGSKAEACTAVAQWKKDRPNAT